MNAIHCLAPPGSLHFLIHFRSTCPGVTKCTGPSHINHESSIMKMLPHLPTGNLKEVYSQLKFLSHICVSSCQADEIQFAHLPQWVSEARSGVCYLQERDSTLCFHQTNEDRTGDMESDFQTSLFHIFHFSRISHKVFSFPKVKSLTINISQSR